MSEQRMQHRHHFRDNPRDRQVDNSPVPEIKRNISSYSRLEDLPSELLVNMCDKMGNYLKQIGLKTNQIRRFLDSVRKLDNQFSRGKNFDGEQVILLKPRLAYAAGRQRDKVGPFMEVLSPAIDRATNSYKSFKKLLTFIEGIVAYHKYYGGGD
ncbi:MAG: type III-A CRISPR-associated protein Csm2 [Proteobacteria bacterium]|nr:type III-A CRISPR-associated protein Csm2 [Pseudomonadota bacterium]